MDYQAVYFEDGENIGVEFPDLPGCFSQGKTLEEAKQNAIQAVACYFSNSDNRHTKLFNPKTNTTVVIPMFADLGEKLQEKILESANI